MTSGPEEPIMSVGRVVLVAAALLFAGATRAQGPQWSDQDKEQLKQAAVWNAQGVQAYRRGDVARATDLCRQALEIRQKLYDRQRFPDGHPQLAESLSNLGGLLQVRG